MKEKELIEKIEQWAEERSLECFVAVLRKAIWI